MQMNFQTYSFSVWYLKKAKDDRCKMDENNRITQLKGPVVQAPAKSSISCGTRVGYSELYPFRSWKAPKMETAQLLLSGRLPNLELENKQPKQGISALIRGVLPLISLERTLHPPSCCFWNQSRLVPADLIEIILTPEEAAANSSLETQTSPDTGERTTERLLGLSQGWLCPPHSLLFSYKMMWELHT